MAFHCHVTPGSLVPAQMSSASDTIKLLFVSGFASRMRQPMAHGTFAHHVHDEGQCYEPQVERETLSAEIEALEPATVASASARE